MHDQPDKLAVALEAAHAAAAQVLNDAFEGEDIQLATMALHVAVRPAVEREDGWKMFVFSWMTQPEVLSELADGSEVRTALAEVMRHNADQLAPRGILKPQAPI
jgi:hypothetical protein